MFLSFPEVNITISVPLTVGTWLEKVGPLLALWNLFTSKFYCTAKLFMYETSPVTGISNPSVLKCCSCIPSLQSEPYQSTKLLKMSHWSHRPLNTHLTAEDLSYLVYVLDSIIFLKQNAFDDVRQNPANQQGPVSSHHSLPPSQHINRYYFSCTSIFKWTPS